MEFRRREKVGEGFEQGLRSVERVVERVMDKGLRGLGLIAPYLLSVVTAQRRGVVEFSHKIVTSRVGIIGYPDTSVMEAGVAGKIGARNFLSPRERKKYSLKTEPEYSI